MRVKKLYDKVIVTFQGNCYWFDTMADAEVFMKNIEDKFLF